MQYQNYLPYATSMESPPSGLTSAFTFSLKDDDEKKKRPREGGKKPKQNKPTNPNPNTSEHSGTNMWYLQETTCYLSSVGAQKRERLQPQEDATVSGSGSPPEPWSPSPAVLPRVGLGETIPSGSQPCRWITLCPSRERGRGQRQEKGEKAFYKGRQF